MPEKAQSHGPGYEEACYRPADGPMHLIALRLVNNGGAAPDADDAREIAELSSFPLLDEALDAILIAEEYGRASAAKAYEALALIIMETLERRAAIGLHGCEWSLDAFDQALEETFSTNCMLRKVRALFRRLRAKMQIANPASGDIGAGEAGDLARLRARIAALSAKTVDHGCTEEEALAAAEKVAELLDRHGEALGAAGTAKQACEGFAIATGRKRGGPLDLCLPALAEFCDCRIWREGTLDGEIRFIIFGLPADIAGARYLYEMIERTFAAETARFKAGAHYRAHVAGGRRSAANAFQTGLAHGVRRKLREIKAAREAARTSGGRDLVVVKTATVDDELDKLGLALEQKRIGGRKRTVCKRSYDAGAAAGAEFEWRPGLTA